MNYLLQISVGPVQDFISAARRTRDLWFGSNMLSEIAKATARSVKDSGGKLIFPAPSTEDDLNPNSDLSVANVILAEFEESDCITLKSVSDKAYEAAKSRLRDYADKVFEKMKYYIVKDRWDSQLYDIVEFYSAWVTIDGDYHSARRKVAKLLAARKNIRDFRPDPMACREYKSSLDGLRESVLMRNDSNEELRGLPKGVRIKPKEALDAIGLIKRVPNEGDWVFPSISRVALDTWIRGKGSKFLSDPDFKAICDGLVETEALSRAKVQGNIYEAFPYDGVVLMPERYKSMIKDSRDEFTSKNLCGKAALYIEHSFRKGDAPSEPYLAFICADGDKMGKALSAMKSADEHREFSRELSSFALKARNVIIKNHGICVYTGGDDVMAFLPLEKALPCSRELHDLFGEIMGKYGASLSVGIAIAHAMEDLSFLFQFGREAEGIAKKGIDGKAAERNVDRNGLAVSVRSRGNIPFVVREQWKNKDGASGLSAMSLDERLEWFAERFMKNEIPAKFPYELRENAKFYDNRENDDDLKGAVISDVIRIFKHKKEIRLDDSEKSNVAEYIKSKVINADTIRELADELILSQWITSGMKDGEELEVQD